MLPDHAPSVKNKLEVSHDHTIKVIPLDGQGVCTNDVHLYGPRGRHGVAAFVFQFFIPSISPGVVVGSFISHGALVGPSKALPVVRLFDWRFSIADCRLAIADWRLPIGDFRFSSAD